eukprot:5036808-Amphidinium_carterae.1
MHALTLGSYAARVRLESYKKTNKGPNVIIVVIKDLSQGDVLRTSGDYFVTKCWLLFRGGASELRDLDLHASFRLLAAAAFAPARCTCQEPTVKFC